MITNMFIMKQVQLLKRTLQLPYISDSAHNILFLSFEIIGYILRNQKIVVGYDSVSF